MRETVYSRLPDAESTALRIKDGEDTLIVFHRHPDGDAIGSGFALRVILSAMGCRAYCVCEDEIPERLRFLTGEMQTSILNDRLPADFTPAQIISVDTASPSQMGTLFDVYGDRVTLMIDHHGKGDMYADGWISPDSAATGEMILVLAEEWIRTGRLASIPSEAMKLLYAAISSDTGCFRYSNATPATHLAAARLLEADFDAADINHRLFAVKSEKLLRAEKAGFDRLRLFLGGRLGIVDIPIAVKREHGFTDEHLDTLVDVARSLAGVEVAVAIRQPSEEPVFRVSMRASCNDVDVSEICAAFGGGGHKKAAGCTLTEAADMEAAVRIIAEALGRVMIS